MTFGPQLIFKKFKNIFPDLYDPFFLKTHQFLTSFKKVSSFPLKARQLKLIYK